MQRGIRRRLDSVRSGRTDLENHVIDEYFTGNIDRRSFLQRAAIVGLAPSMAAFLAACGSSSKESSTGTAAGGAGAGTTTAGKAGGTLKVGMTPPNGPIDPIATNNLGRLQLISQVGEYLCFSEPDLTLTPVLAEKWTPNADATEWTFNAAQGREVPQRRRDEGRRRRRHVRSPRRPGQQVERVVGAQGRAVEGQHHRHRRLHREVQDRLAQRQLPVPRCRPTTTTPSSCRPTYAGDFEKTFDGTGPWKLDKYTPDVSLSLVRNADYWGDKTLLDKLELTFYKDDAALASALQAGTVDVAHGVSANGATRRCSRPGSCPWP